VKAAHAMMLVTLLGATASVARAEQTPPPTPAAAKLYDDYVARTEGSGAARTALAEMVRRCEFSEMSRSGPLPGQVAGCERSEHQAIGVGADVVPDALRMLNADDLGYGVRSRVYDLLARVGDLRALHPLVEALAKIAAGENEGGADQDFIAQTLARLSYAKVGERAPWSQDDEDPKGVAAEWRSWLKEHSGMSRAELLRERVTDARAHVADGDAGAAFVAARSLLQQPATRGEGLVALRSLLHRPNLPENAVDAIHELVPKSSEPRHLPRKHAPAVMPNLS
jgi:hypothetical protein